MHNMAQGVAAHTSHRSPRVHVETRDEPTARADADPGRGRCADARRHPKRRSGTASRSLARPAPCKPRPVASVASAVHGSSRDTVRTVRMWYEPSASAEMGRTYISIYLQSALQVEVERSCAPHARAANIASRASFHACGIASCSAQPRARRERVVPGRTRAV